MSYGKSAGLTPLGKHRVTWVMVSHQGSPHLVNTGWHELWYASRVETGLHDLCLRWLESESEGKPGRLLKSLYFSTSFHIYTTWPSAFHKTNVLQSTSLKTNIEYQTLYRSNFRNRGVPYAWIWKKGYDFIGEKILTSKGWYTALRSKSKYWSTQNRDNISEWSDMSTHDCCFSELAL